MSHIQAIYRRGVFEPLERVDLREDQRVQLDIEPASDESPLRWLDQVAALRASLLNRNCLLPDSSSEIAADRAR